MPRTLIHEKLLEIAYAEIGVKEIAGEDDNSRIIEYKQSTPSVINTHDEIAWCASFVNWVLKQAGIVGTGNPMARSFMPWGFGINVPTRGCITILKRGAPPSGHVGFFITRKSPGNWIQVLGGNQSDQVKLSFYPESDVIGYRVVEL
jgi:uncharacterized protein (TIGR02594 family)